MSTKITYDDIFLAILPSVLSKSTLDKVPYEQIQKTLWTADCIAEDVANFFGLRQIAFTHKELLNYEECDEIKKTFQNIAADIKRNKPKQWIDLISYFETFDFSTDHSSVSSLYTWADMFRYYVEVIYPEKQGEFQFRETVVGDRGHLEVFCEPKVYVVVPSK